MEASTKLKKFLSSAKGYLVTFYVFAALCAACIIGAVAASKEPLPDAVAFTPATATGAYAYIDVQYMTDWLLKVTGDSNYTYYLAGDEDFNLFIVSMRAARYADFSDIVAFSDSDSTIAPPTIRLYGVVSRIDSEDKENLADVLGVPASDLDTSFGGIYLDAKRTQSNSAEGGFLLGALFFGILMLIFYIVFASNNGRKRSMKRLEKLGLTEQAEAEFEAESNLVFGLQGIVISANFVYCKYTGQVLSCNDIVWMFQRIQRYWFIPIGKSLVANTIDGKSKVLTSKHLNDDTINEIAQRIYERNPNVLYGFNGANQSEWRQRVKAAKNA